jgi:uncharacterized RDD family membrane protein YckC
MKNCTYCGKENSTDVTNCRECGTEFTAPNTIQDKSPSAGFGIRALARIIDTIYGLFVGLSAGMLVGIILGILNSAGYVPAGWQHRIHGFTATSIGLGLLGVILYHFFCEGVHGATLGKLCCGICVVTEDGRPSTLKGALIRNLAYYIDALFFGLVGYESMKKSSINQRYGDKWAKTAVFKTKKIPSESQRSPLLLITGLLLGTGCWIVMLVLGLILKVL